MLNKWVQIKKSIFVNTNKVIPGAADKSLPGIIYWFVLVNRD